MQRQSEIICWCHQSRCLNASHSFSVISLGALSLRPGGLKDIICLIRAMHDVEALTCSYHFYDSAAVSGASGCRRLHLYTILPWSVNQVTQNIDDIKQQGYTDPSPQQICESIKTCRGGFILPVLEPTDPQSSSWAHTVQDGNDFGASLHLSITRKIIGWNLQPLPAWLWSTRLYIWGSAYPWFDLIWELQGRNRPIGCNEWP
jgi:hypothetical protein